MSASGGEEDLNVKTSASSQVGAVKHLEHLSVNSNGAPKTDDRGRYLDNLQHSNGIKSDQTDGVNFHGERPDQCPARPKCATPSRSSHEHGTDPALAVDVIVAHGNSGDGPNEETRCQTRIERGVVHSVTGGVGADARQAKRKHRRRPSKKKRRWKPYYKLSWEERKEIDERETARASRTRAEMFAKGLPVAPYNTTQFLMDEHDREEPDLNTETRARGLGGICRIRETASEDDLLDLDDGDDGSGGGSDGIGRPGNAGGEYLQRDFSETYEKYHEESLQNMSKQELVQEYLELEKCMSRLEEENARLRLDVDAPSADAERPLHAPGTERIRELERELEALRTRNKELRAQCFSDDQRTRDEVSLL